MKKTTKNISVSCVLHREEQWRKDDHAASLPGGGVGEGRGGEGRGGEGTSNNKKND